MKGKRFLKDKGFSLVELLIAISIMAILAASVAPALIRYITKARKADDIAAADTIAVTVNAAISSDDDMYEYIQWNIKELGNNNGYRIIGYSSVATGDGGESHNTPFIRNNIGGHYADAQAQGDAFADFMNQDLGDTLVKMRFMKFSKLDQWILCVDKKGQLSVWVGADLNGNQWTIDGTTHQCSSSSQKYYMIWPDVDSDYMMLNNANDVPG